MGIYLAYGEPGVLHVVEKDNDRALCGTSPTGPVDEGSWDDLLCGNCMGKLAPRSDEFEFGDNVYLQLDRFLANRLARLPYRLYLKTQHWKRIRALALDRYGDSCVLCNQRPVDVHHRTYERLGRERLDDLVVLCDPCHATYHQQAS